MQSREREESVNAFKHSVDWPHLQFIKYHRAFMIFAIFADESYSEQRKPVVIVVAGWAAAENKWEQFCKNWQSVLDEYGVKEGFHFVEFAQRKHKNYEKTSYDGWSDLKKENFLYSLALAACDCGFPIGGAWETEELTQSAIKTAYRSFFTSLAQTVKKIGNPEDKFKLIFDTNRDKNWLIPRTEALNEATGKNFPFKSGFIMESAHEFLHLQAADLYAYAVRQNAERHFKKNENKEMEPRLLDLILEKNRHDKDNAVFSLEDWTKLMNGVIAHYREWSKTNPSADYRPLLHCPILKQ